MDVLNTSFSKSKKTQPEGFRCGKMCLCPHAKIEITLGSSANFDHPIIPLSLDFIKFSGSSQTTLK